MSYERSAIYGVPATQNLSNILDLASVPHLLFAPLWEQGTWQHNWPFCPATEDGRRTYEQIP